MTSLIIIITIITIIIIYSAAAAAAAYNHLLLVYIQWIQTQSITALASLRDATRHPWCYLGKQESVLRGKTSTLPKTTTTTI